MAEPSIEGLRQAFLDPDSRIRLSSEEPPSPHICIEAMEWEGGFLDGVHVRLNENLNVLIGGRGAGKSTVVESIRHAFGMTPTTEEAARSHHSMVKDVIGQNTTIRVLVSSPRPAPRKYRIVRDGANPPEVYDVDGKPLSVEPGFVVGNIQVYGQHELSELSRREDKQRRLLERFATDSEAMQKKKRELQRKLKESREGIRRLREEMNRLEEQLVEQPKVEETLRRYETLGIEEKLKARSALVKEERILKTARERLEPLEELLAVLRDASPDLAFLSDAALADLAGKEILTRLRQPLALVHETLAKMHKELGSLKARALDDVGFVETTWQTEREQPVLQEYQSILKKLDRESVNGDEFIELQKQLEEMKPRKDQYGQMQRNLAALRDDRTSLLVEWEEVKMQDRRGWSGVGKRVSKKLAGNVRVVMGKEDRSTLEELFREHVDGKFSKSLQHLLEEEALNAKDLADGIHKGADALRSAYACLTPQAAERLADAGENLAMRIEEEDWPQLPEISLNLGTEENTHFVPLPRLSTGQKATALLCLLLLESDAPLVIDQPEDDLDNRFISEYIVPRMKQEKQRRQFLFASHNANIPVLGDADLIIGLTTESDKASGKISGVIKPGHMGAIDNQPVRGLIEEILEGGRNAFSTRRAKYGF
nr:MAG: AAA domain [Candidatus Kentron sp. TUN]VFK53059.1 MAG: AAA domain [Candidatus Kentron sp. TUN]